MFEVLVRLSIFVSLARKTFVSGLKLQLMMLCNSVTHQKTVMPITVCQR